MIHKGLLVRWNEDRGFGFIKPSSDNEEIFIHVSVLKHMVRRPVVGDVIHYQLNIDGNSKKKAVNANIEGVQKRKYNNRKKSFEGPYVLLRLITFIVIVSIGYRYYQSNSDLFLGIGDETFESEDYSGFSCQGKQFCSEMVSCKEANFYLNNCPGVKIDGDNDGVPCESQWCN